MTLLEDLPNVGPAIAADFVRLGIRTPRALTGRDPYALYDELNRITGTRHDPCVLDTFIAAVRFMGGAPARPWWKYTAERKRTLAQRAARAAPPPPKKAPPVNGEAKILGASLSGLGPVSKRMLAAAGITSLESLHRLGVVEAYPACACARPARVAQPAVGARRRAPGRPWRSVARNDRLSLLLRLENRPDNRS